MSLTKENGIKASNMVMGYGRELMEIPILESGKIQKQKDMEFIYGKMVIDMKENGEDV
jgi:hypothetical protein